MPGRPRKVPEMRVGESVRDRIFGCSDFDVTPAGLHWRTRARPRLRRRLVAEVPWRSAASGYGVDNAPENAFAAIRNGVNVLQFDLVGWLASTTMPSTTPHVPVAADRAPYRR